MLSLSNDAVVGVRRVYVYFFCFLPALAVPRSFFTRFFFSLRCLLEPFGFS